MASLPASTVRAAVYSKLASRRGRELVLNVLKDSPKPLGGSAIYKEIMKKYPDEKTDLPPPNGNVVWNHSPGATIVPPPHPEHPIRSIKYLKKIILTDLEGRRLVKKVHVARPPTPEELALARRSGKGRKGLATNTKIPSLTPQGLINEWGYRVQDPPTEEQREADALRLERAKEGQVKNQRKVLEKREKVAFSEEWGHLNLRRQRARVEKLDRQAELAKELEKFRERGRREVARRESTAEATASA